MASDSKIVFDIVAHDKASHAFDSAGRGSDNLKQKLGTMARAAGLAFAAAGVGLVKLGADAVAAARESEKINAITAQTIKSMGNAAGLSAKQVADLATKLSNLSGVDDEVIQGGANILLTFGNISKKGGVFDQTLALANDMSVALGKDMTSSSTMLGKALNDPIAGLSALGRVGVQFNQQQKDQIKLMVESGDLLGAQGVILKEVGRQFGGAAEAAATPMDRLKVTLGNLQEEVGARLIPVIDRLAVWLADNLPGMIDKATRAFRTFADGIDFVKRNWNIFEPIIIAGAVAVTAVLVTLGVQATGSAAAVAAAWLVAMGPIPLVVAAVAGLAYAFRQNWDTIRSVAIDGVRAVVGAMLTMAEEVLGLGVSAFGWVPKVGDKLRDAEKAVKTFRETTEKSLNDMKKDYEIKVRFNVDPINMAAIDAGIIGAQTRARRATGDAPGDFRGTVIGGGPVLKRVQGILGSFAGARITSTYRSPADNARVGGARNSLHMDRNNPAVDIGGPTSVLDRVAARLRDMGGWRQLLWRVAGHYDHVHVAHAGGLITPGGVAPLPPLRSDERLVKAQIGEVVLTQQQQAGFGGSRVVNIYAPDDTAANLVRLLEREAWMSGVLV